MMVSAQLGAVYTAILESSLVSRPGVTVKCFLLLQRQTHLILPELSGWLSHRSLNYAEGCLGLTGERHRALQGEDDLRYL